MKVQLHTGISFFTTNQRFVSIIVAVSVFSKSSSSSLRPVCEPSSISNTNPVFNTFDSAMLSAKSMIFDGLITSPFSIDFLNFFHSVVNPLPCISAASVRMIKAFLSFAFTILYISNNVGIMLRQWCYYINTLGGDLMDKLEDILSVLDYALNIKRKIIQLVEFL